jgi:hypothetical protein
VVDCVRKDGKLEKRLYELIVLIVAALAGGLCLGGPRSARPRRRLSADVVDALRRHDTAVPDGRRRHL